jgi:hypothetical protein
VTFFTPGDLIVIYRRGTGFHPVMFASCFDSEPIGSFVFGIVLFESQENDRLFVIDSPSMKMGWVYKFNIVSVKDTDSRGTLGP